MGNLIDIQSQIEKLQKQANDIKAKEFTATVHEIQAKMQEASKGFYDNKGMPNPEMWTQFMSMQTPMVQSMMSNYIEQSKNMFVSMQDQFQDQARNLFTNFKFPVPGAPQGDTTKE